MAEPATQTADELPTRWEVELEFVQSLANIQYVNWLAQNDYLADPAFVNYLQYLSYWKEPKYAKYVVYPDCLHVLTLLQSEDFRKSIVNPELINTLMNDMVKRWQSQEDSIELAQKTKEDGEKDTKINSDSKTLPSSTQKDSAPPVSETPSIVVEHSS